MSILEDIRDFWDEDADTYDASSEHRPRDPAVNAAWAAALERLLPPAPSEILDCGAGTGFLAQIAARLGHHVTALDMSPAMLERLDRAADAEGLTIACVEAPADEPPARPGGFDVVMERHLLWTLPDPAKALVAWRAAAPAGRLLLIESLWGGVDPVEQLRQQARRTLRRLRRTPAAHHGSYPDGVRRALPLGRGTHPSEVVRLVTAAGWPNPRVGRLNDVAWAETLSLPLLERLVGVTPRFAVLAGP